MSESVVAQPAGILAPVGPAERIEILDILRGFAVFGILLVNMQYFSAPAYLVASDVRLWGGAADRVAAWLIRWFAEGKFYSLFSVLFGLGFFLQMARAESRGARFVWFYRRRLFGLLLIGLAHAFLLWSGDILVAYALFGFLLLLFRRRSNRTVLVWVIIALCFPVVVAGAGAAAVELGRTIPQAARQIDASFARTAAEYQRLIAQCLEVYSRGSYAEILGQLAADTFFLYATMIFWAPTIFAMFLLGFYLGRRGFFQNLTAHLPLARKALWWGAGLGLPCNLVYVVTREVSNPAVPSLTAFLGTAFFAVGAPALCLFYVSALALLAQRESWQKRLAPLAAVGRMALSNYLLQSVIAAAIFYSYGLGLYGKVGPAAGLLLTLGIYLLQIPMSVWWLRHVRFGPLEWLWRSLTYGRFQPMRAVVPVATTASS